MHRIPSNAVLPGAVGRSFDRPVTFPDGAVAFESTAEGDLPNSIPLLHPPLRLDVP